MRFRLIEAVAALALPVSFTTPLRAQTPPVLPTCSYVGTLSAMVRTDVSVYRLAVLGQRGPLTISQGGTVPQSVMAQYLSRMVSVRAKRSSQGDLTLFDIFPAFGRVDEDVGSGCLQDLEGDGNYAAQANAISADGKVIVGAKAGGHAWK